MKFTPWMRQNTWRGLVADSRLRRGLTVGVLLLTVGFLVALLIRGHEELQQFDDWHAYLTACAQGFLLYPLSLWLQALIWGMMIARLGRVTWGWRDIEIYAFTHLMRSLPGAVWYLGGRVAMYRGRGMGSAVTLAASGLEWLLLLMAAALTYALMGLPDPNLRLRAILMLTLLLAGNLCALKAVRSPLRLRWLPGSIRRWLGALSDAPVPRLREIAVWIGSYGLAYVIGGLILFLIVRRVVPVSTVTLASGIRVWAMVSGVSLLTSMFVPGGMGIRELTLTALLARDVPTVAAAATALSLRMLFIAGDLAWAGLMWGVAVVVGRNRQRGGTHCEGQQGHKITYEQPKKGGVGTADCENTTNG